MAGGKGGGRRPAGRGASRSREADGARHITHLGIEFLDGRVREGGVAQAAAGLGDGLHAVAVVRFGGDEHHCVVSLILSRDRRRHAVTQMDSLLLVDRWAHKGHLGSRCKHIGYTILAGAPRAHLLRLLRAARQAAAQLYCAAYAGGYSLELLKY